MAGDQSIWRRGYCMTDSARIEISGDKSLMRDLARMTDEVRREVEIESHHTAQELRTMVIKAYHHGPASGSVYEKYNPRRTHRASAAGEAPMSDTGRLASRTLVSTSGIGAEVWNDTEYAAWLEYGTTKMAARPAWGPAVDKIEPIYLGRLRAIIDRAAGK